MSKINNRPENPNRGDMFGDEVWMGDKWYVPPKPYYSHQLFLKLKEVQEWIDNAEYDPGIPGADGGSAYMCEYNGLYGHQLIEQIKKLIEAKDDIEEN